MLSDGAWARKYRPKSYTDYIGDTVKEIVKNRFKEDSLPNVVLISGTRGSGKTSMAWLLSKEYNCLHKIDGHACNECEMCTEINTHIENAEAGMQVYGVQEIDIAAEGRRANIDEIIEEALLLPQYPLKYKILIMDEFHMASKNVQNRLLKIMEEPPKHLVFILCTTNPEAIIPTILSRCQVRLEVQRADKDSLVDRLMYISQCENLKVTKEALTLIATQTDRIPREAIMLLESVAMTNNKKVTKETVYKQLNVLDVTNMYVQFYEAANSNNLENVVAFIHTLKQNTDDLIKFTDGLIKFTLECVYVKYGYDLEEHSAEFLKMVKKLFSLYSNTEMTGLLQILENTATKMHTTGQAEMRLITMALRIGNIGLLRNALANRKEESERENKNASRIYASEHKLSTTEVQKEVPIEKALEDISVDLKSYTRASTPSITEDDDSLPVDEKELLDFFGN